MRLLVTGAAGMLGQDLVRASEAAGYETVGLSRDELDIAEAGAVRDAIADRAPDIVVNCAAWTDVDGAETSAQTAHAVNGDGAGNVAAAAASAGAWMIQVSTDYVFDGSKRSPYLESDPVAPASVYGASKLAGEREVVAHCPERHTIVRASWLFGTNGRCFPATILRLAEERDELTVVDDQVGCPTFTCHLAQGIVALAEEPPPIGVVHVAGAGSCSWYELAREVVSTAGLSCELRPGRTEDLARPAPRPAYSVLRTERGASVPRLPDWHEGVAEYMSAALRTA
jgi:dTDP-4-dehydrorhamnose reductase